jgi:hypothetical protein
VAAAAAQAFAAQGKLAVREIAFLADPKAANPQAGARR